jgi:hypothetical protein
MPSARIAKLLLLFALMVTPWSAAQPDNTITGFSTLENPYPLQLTIRQTSSKPIFQADIHNDGKEPLYLFLGEPFSGMQDVDAINLSITDDKGRTFPLLPKESFRFMEGITHAIIVALQPGEIRSYPFDLGNYYSSGERGRMISSLTPGQYTL